MSNLVAAALTAVTLLLLTPVFAYLPQATLGAVVLVASARMIDLDALRRLWRVRRSDFVLAAVTAAGVLVVGVLPGIGVGVGVSLLEVSRRGHQARRRFGPAHARGRDRRRGDRRHGHHGR